ncbi:MAG: hypothetical protein CBB97_25835 [Candidatus Endolissoclinum sp. TMED37]|nr:MAG: hypothetical protein CBB97_25775 [Candidatus Endolissoclinum sp. TMED37]OUU13641.1 MAG: hypothetical protein CBB97_25835 [Candidatus Endolissoclinum sp. TMED37]|tara:strand:- start:1357 stop:1668 length:312 start_codon:yes stop_codon:yes gene_type:complete
MYKLTDEDYRGLWLVASPYQIEKEFGSRSHSVRTIYRRYEKYGLSSIKEHQKRLCLQLAEKSAPGTPESHIKEQIRLQSAQARYKSFQQLWKKIKEHEALFDV